MGVVVLALDNLIMIILWHYLCKFQCIYDKVVCQQHNSTITPTADLVVSARTTCKSLLFLAENWLQNF